MAKIFIVEDEPSLQFLYQKILRAEGFQIIGIAKDGEEAISMFKNFPEKPQIILMDHRMPKKNGIETSKMILQLDNSVKILFLSADSSIKDEALALGICDFQEKPFSITTLLTKIKELLILI
ncbi:MAG: response regulator transcription factor [Candidatus Helarchaeota archaeon]